MMSDAERSEFSRTFYVKHAGILSGFRAQLKTLLSRPISYLKGVALAIRLGSFNPGKTLLRLFYFAEAVVIGQWMAREGLDHCHTHFSSTVALFLGRVFPVTISMTIHGPSEFDEPAEFHLSRKIAESEFVVAISSYGKSQLMRYCSPEEWNKIEAIPLGIDPSTFRLAIGRDNPAPFEIICVGRLVPVKAQRVLLHAVARLVEEGRNVRLRLVGDGPDRTELESLAQTGSLMNHVVFEGWRSEAEVVELLKNADVFALASFAEGLPVALMEAMAMGVPCAATGITGIPELIQNGVSGLLVPPADEEALTRALARLIDDPYLRRRIGHAGRGAVVEKFNLDTNVRRLARVFEERVFGQPASPEELQLHSSRDEEERLTPTLDVDEATEGAFYSEF
jgi:glycosyltransferase involved in cell wall biosynthesis